jgi:hypothetical protein
MPLMDTPGALGPASKKRWLVLPLPGVPSPKSRSHRPVMAIGVPFGWSSCRLVQSMHELITATSAVPQDVRPVDIGSGAIEASVEQ